MLHADTLNRVRQSVDLPGYSGRIAALKLRFRCLKAKAVFPAYPLTVILCPNTNATPNTARYKTDELD